MGIPKTSNLEGMMTSRVIFGVPCVQTSPYITTLSLSMMTLLRFRSIIRTGVSENGGYTWFMANLTSMRNMMITHEEVFGHSMLRKTYVHVLHGLYLIQTNICTLHNHS